MATTLARRRETSHLDKERQERLAEKQRGTRESNPNRRMSPGLRCPRLIDRSKNSVKRAGEGWNGPEGRQFCGQVLSKLEVCARQFGSKGRIAPLARR
jgi:hypothetical protein